MEAKEGTVTISIDEYRKLYNSYVNLKIARKSVQHLIEPDGGLRIPLKCVNLLLQIMEVE